MKLRYWITSSVKNIIFDCIIRLFNNKDFYFVQIGAHDGFTNDPINRYVKRYSWRGLLVEPVKKMFDRLKSNYRYQKGLIFENVAVSTKNEVKKLYKIRQGAEGVPDWCDQISSFMPEVILRHEKLVPSIRENLIAEETVCVTLNDLLQKHRIKNIDLLQIDTEGFDFDIIKSLDFNVFRPRIIRYENFHLRGQDKEECAALLKKNGYFIINLGEDTVAFSVRK